MGMSWGEVRLIWGGGGGGGALALSSLSQRLILSTSPNELLKLPIRRHSPPCGRDSSSKAVDLVRIIYLYVKDW